MVDFVLSLSPELSDQISSLELFWSGMHHNQQGQGYDGLVYHNT